MPCSNSPTALLCCMWGQRNGANARNLKPASAASWSFKRGNAVENRNFMCYNFNIALDSRFEKESTMDKNLKRKRHTPKKGRVIFRKMLYQRWGTARKYCKSLPEAKQKNPTTTGHMLYCWEPGCARVTDWFDWGRHPLGEAYSYRHKWGGNPKIGQHKITIIKENFGIWN